MKKTDVRYAAAWYGGEVLLILALLVFGVWNAKNGLMSGLSALGIVAVGVATPILMNKQRDKKAAELAKNFPHKLRFTTHNGIFYFDPAQSRAAVVWKLNPFELQTIDLAQVTGVRTCDGRQFRGTSRVWAEFVLDGKKIKVTTLQVSRGQLGMKDPRVLEAISKADQICEMIRAGQRVR